MSTFFDDFLNLGARDLGGLRLIVFSGVSGSGKTTAMRFLAESHSGFRGRPVLELDCQPDLRSAPQVTGHLILCDEVTQVRQLAGLARLMRNRNTVAVAAHLPLAMFRPYGFFGSAQYFRTDRGAEKIARYLDRSRLSYSRATVAAYCKLYGANYVDLHHMLERFPNKNFDRTFAQFQKFCRMIRTAS